MPKEGYKVITVKKDNYSKAEKIKKKLAKKSVSATVGELIQKKYEEVSTNE